MTNPSLVQSLLVAPHLTSYPCCSRPSPLPSFVAAPPRLLAEDGGRRGVAADDDGDTTGKAKPTRNRPPTPPSWRQVVSTAAGFLGVLLACIYGSRMLMVPPTVAVGGFYFILGGALLVPLQAPSVR